MSYHQRRLGVAQGISLIEAAIYDALFEARENGEGGLQRTVICARLGLPEDGIWWHAIGSFLHDMEAGGDVTNDNPDGGPGSWRLVRDAIT